MQVAVAPDAPTLAQLATCERPLSTLRVRIGILGGINIDDVYSSSGSSPGPAESPRKDDLPWRDSDIEIAGPAVAELQRLFHETWQRQKGPPLPERNYFPRLPTGGDEIVRMQGWSNGRSIKSGDKRWDPAALTALMNADIFECRAPGLRY